MTSTNSEPGPESLGKNSIAKKLAFFRANVNSADEGIDEHKADSSSDTEGEDLVSEEEESKHDIVKTNGHENIYCK